MKNYGCYIISFIILLYFIELIIFLSFSFYKIQSNIVKIIFALNNTKVAQAKNNNNDIVIVKTQSSNKRKKERKKKLEKLINKLI